MEPRKGMDRTRAEFILGVILALAAMVLPMTWWLRGVLLALMLSLAIDLIWRSPLTARFGRLVRVAMIAIFCGVIFLASWKPLQTEYVAEGGLTSLSDFSSWFFRSEYFRLLLAALVGALIGNQLDPLRPRPRRKRPADNRKWVKSYAALQLADSTLVESHSAVRVKIDALNVKMSEIVQEWKNANGSLEKIRDAESKRDDLNREIEKHRDQSDRFWGQMQRSVHDKLSTGELVAQGFLMPVKPHDDPIPIPVVQWNFLRLTGDFTEASGKGISYVGMQIARTQS